MKHRLSLLAVLPVALLLVAAAPTTRESQTGSFTTSFKERSPLSAVPTIADRMGVTVENMTRKFPERDYGLASETFDVYVPRACTGAEPYGLLVWVSPGARVGMAPGWAQLLDKYKLIWIGANKSGNDRAPFIRIGLAIDAAHNMTKLYSIDESRVYVSGVSGGGRISSMVAMGFSELFSGGFYICGCSYYRKMISLEQGGSTWTPEFLMPPKNVLAQSKTCRHVFLTGSQDINREQTQVYANAYKRDGFKHITYIEVPGMGHGPPEADWFEKGLLALDASPGTPSSTTRPASPPKKTPLAPANNDKAAAELKAARELASKDPVAACDALQRIAITYPNAKEAIDATLDAEKLLADPKIKTAVHDRQEADKLIRVARIYIDSRMYDEAKDRIKKVLDEYPNTPSAPLAKKMLQEIK